MKFIGAHVSSASGLWKVFERAEKIDADSISFFLGNQRTWKTKSLSSDVIENFKIAAQKSKIKPQNIMPHGSYLINLGNPDFTSRQRSYTLFQEEVSMCEALGIKLYNLHPGSTVASCSIRESIEFIAESINKVHQATKLVTIVLESTAGQGNTIGRTFEELRDIINLIEDKERVGICIDTCHMFAAGYDFRSKNSYEATMNSFETTIGWKFLKGFHINDSGCQLGERKDRHENIGKGKIGLEAFRHIMKDSRLDEIPMILETPCSEDGMSYRDEIGLLKSMC